ncbi:MAG: beta-ketoacyl reductase, partial [Lacisediminimonas sp.]|nr:beta-ketoacyl reductase [Lacisediminimonas sp.]
MQAWREQGVQVAVMLADVADHAAVAGLMATVRSQHPPVRGIIHAAGMLDDATIAHQSWQKFAAVMGPKVQGAWHLHQLTLGTELDFFILLSSAASLLGSPGQANHSAANGFLDGLAHYRHGRGLRAQSLHLGTVSQIGEAAERGADIRAQQQGLGAITPQQVLAALGHLLQHPEQVEVGLADLDWQSGKLPAQWQEWPYVAHWLRHVPAVPAQQASAFMLRLRAAAPAEQANLLMAYVKQQIALVLGLANGQSIDAGQGFFELGMDSLTSVELRNRLQRGLGIALPTTALMDYPSAQTLVRFILEQINPGGDSKPKEALPSPELVAANQKASARAQVIQELSEANAEELLRGKLKKRARTGL